MAIATRSSNGIASSSSTLSQLSPPILSRMARMYGSSTLFINDGQCEFQNSLPRSARDWVRKPAIVEAIRRCFSSHHQPSHLRTSENVLSLFIKILIAGSSSPEKYAQQAAFVRCPSSIRLLRQLISHWQCTGESSSPVDLRNGSFITALTTNNNHHPPLSFFIRRW